MDNLEKIKKKIEEIQIKTLVASDLKAFVALVLKVISDAKTELMAVCNENINQIKEALNFISTEHTQILKEIDDKNKKVEGTFEGKIKQAESIVTELKAIEVKDGYTPVKGVDYFDGINPNPEEVVPLVLAKIPPTTPEELRDKLETLEGEDRLDAKAIKNLPKTVEKSIIAHQQNVAWYDETTFLIQNPTRIKVQGAGVQLSQDSEGALVMTISGGSGGTTFEDETMTDSGDHTTFTISFTPSSGTLLVINENTGQAVPTSSYTNTTTSITFNQSQEVDDGASNMVTPTFRARYSH